MRTTIKRFWTVSIRNRICRAAFVFICVCGVYCNASANPPLKEFKVVPEDINRTTFTGGVFRSDSRALESITEIPNDGAMVYVMFRDGLVVKASISNVGVLYVSRIGVWAINGGLIECRYVPSHDLSIPDEEFRVISLGIAGEPETRYLTTQLNGWAKMPLLDLLLKSYSSEPGIDNIEAHRAEFWQSIVTGEMPSFEKLNKP